MENCISIHAPRVGSDGIFLGLASVHPNFYPRSPRGERHTASKELFIKEVISIHAPRVGSDHRLLPHGRRCKTISIHAPRVGSDVCNFGQLQLLDISIHAPRVGSDTLFL